MNSAQVIFNAILPYIAVGGGITVLTQILKRLVNIQNSAVARLLFHTVTVAITAITYLLGDHGISYLMLVLHGSAYSGIASALYPLVSKVDGFLVKLREALKLVSQTATAAEQVINEAAGQVPPAADF